MYLVVDVKYKKQSSESYDDYWWRMCSNKESSIYDLTWEELGAILNEELDEGYTSSKWRKNFQVMKKGYNMAIEKDIESNDIIEEIELKKLELYKERVKASDQLRELRKVRRDEARVENIQDTFVECAEIISKEKPLKVESYPSHEGKRAGVIQLSDWHMGEFIDNFMNTYNQDVFDKRINKLTIDVIEYSKLMDVGTLKVLNCGDFISGGLHIGSRISDEEDSVYQIMYVAEAIANMLLEFAKEIDKVEFYSVVDNHSRVSRNKKESIEQESFARFIPWHLKTRLKDVKNIEIVENKINDVVEYDIGIFDIFDEKALFTHGHNDKIPSMVQNLTLMTRVFPIAIFTGHLHRSFEDEVHGIDLIMNPSAVGSGEYSKSIRKSSKPRQKLTIYEKKNEKVERVSTFLINL